MDKSNWEGGNMKNNEIIKWAIISMLLPIGGIIGGIYFFWMFWAIIFGMV